MGHSVLNVRGKFRYRFITPESPYICIWIQDLNAHCWQYHDITGCTEFHFIALQLYYSHQLFLDLTQLNPKLNLIWLSDPKFYLTLI